MPHTPAGGDQSHQADNRLFSHHALTADASGLASALEPALRAACQERLGAVRWFRSAWQAGGASTGLSSFRLDDGQSVDVVIKLPVGPIEYRWTTALGGMPHLYERITDGPINGNEAHQVELSTACACAMGPTPRVYAAGTEIGGYDLAWLVVERLAGEPLHKSLGREAFEDLLFTAAEWYASAELLRPVASAPTPPPKDWGTLLDKARRAIPDSTIEHPQMWTEAVKAVQKHLPLLVRQWDAREINAWCHGDLHPGNAMRRHGAWWFAGHHCVSGSQPTAARNGCVLIDLALVHPGHWVEDAVYLERLFWGRTERLGGLKPVSYLAQARRELGLSCSDDYTRLANTRRVLMAGCVPAFLAHEGNHKYVEGALAVLERVLPLVTR